MQHQRQYAVRRPCTSTRARAQLHGSVCFTAPAPAPRNGCIAQHNGYLGLGRRTFAVLHRPVVRDALGPTELRAALPQRLATRAHAPQHAPITSRHGMLAAHCKRAHATCTPTKQSSPELTAHGAHDKGSVAMALSFSAAGGWGAACRRRPWPAIPDARSAARWRRSCHPQQTRARVPFPSARQPPGPTPTAAAA